MSVIQGLFRSPFMLPMLAFHFSLTGRARNLVGECALLHHQPVGVIALAAAAVSRPSYSQPTLC